MKPASHPAPHGPGISARWTSSAKTGVGTALSNRSRVWFMLSHGIFNEIYYPRIDQACVRDMGMIVTDKAVFSGSIIRQGESGAMVYATGERTYFGKTAQLVQEAHTVSHFQKAVLKIGNYLIILAVALVAVIIGFAVYRGDAILTTLQFALVLTVAAIPVTMPTVLSVTMAVGARFSRRSRRL